MSTMERIRQITREEGEDRKEEILRFVNMDDQGFRAEARDWKLDAAKLALFDEYENLSYLLSD